MIVVRNTYPRWPGVNRAEIGDEVEWEVFLGRQHLVRKGDRLTIFSRDVLPNGVEDNRPVCGIIAQVKSNGWMLELAEKT